MDNQESMAHLDIAKRSVRGSTVLFVGNMGAVAVSAVAVIVIARLLGPTNYGIYTLVLLVPSFLICFLGFGVDYSLIRFSAYSISQGRPEEAKRYAVNGIRFLWMNGAALALLEFALAGPLSSLLINRPGLTPYVQLVSLAVFGSMILTTVTATAIGWNQMGLSALSNVSQAFVKLALAPLLIIVGLGVTGAIVGQLTSSVAAGVVGTAALYLWRLRGASGRGKFFEDSKTMLTFGLPLYAGTVVNGLATLFASFVLAYIATNNVYGWYQAASNFIVPMTTVSSALTYALFPAFASFDGVGGDVRVAFKQAYRFVAFLLTPVTFFLLAAAGPLMHVLYGASYDGGIGYLQLLAIAYLPTAFGYTVHIAFFNGFARPKLTMVLQTVAGAVLFVAAPLLAIAADWRVDGIIYANLLSDFAAWAMGTVLADRYMNARLDFKANAAILLSAAVSCGATALVSQTLGSSALTLLADLLVFTLSYLTLAPLLGAIKTDDMSTMEHTFAGLGIVSRLIGLLLRYVKLILSIGK